MAGLWLWLWTGGRMAGLSLLVLTDGWTDGLFGVDGWVDIGEWVYDVPGSVGWWGCGV